jgi:hypothetical protein
MGVLVEGYWGKVPKQPKKCMSVTYKCINSIREHLNHNLIIGVKATLAFFLSDLPAS